MVQWAEYFDSIGGFEKIDVSDSRFKKMVRNGIPSVFRTQVWCKLTKVDEKMNHRNDFYIHASKCREAIPSSVIDVIEKDIPRTFTGAIGFKDYQLRNVLYAFALLHPEIGYCQSMNFLAAVLIACCGEEPAFWILCALIEDYLPSDYYVSGMKGFCIDLKLIEILINERTPDIAKLSTKLHHEWMMTTSGWLLTLFSNSFPIPTVMRIWDSLFLEGPKIVYRVSIAFLRIVQDSVIHLNNLSLFSKTLSDLQNQILDQDKLMEVSFSIKAFSRNHLIELRDRAKRIVEGNTSESEKAGFALHSLFGQFNL